MGRYLPFLPLGSVRSLSTAPSRATLLTTSHHHPPPYPVRKGWNNPCNLLLTFFFENPFFHLVPHFGVLHLFYLDISVRIKEDDIHRAWYLTGAQGVWIAPHFSDSASPPLKQVSQALRGWGAQSNTSLQYQVKQESLPPFKHLN